MAAQYPRVADETGMSFITYFTGAVRQITITFRSSDFVFEEIEAGVGIRHSWVFERKLFIYFYEIMILCLTALVEEQIKGMQFHHLLCRKELDDAMLPFAETRFGKYPLPQQL